MNINDEIKKKEVVILLGRKRAGKDTIMQEICDNLQNQTTRVLKFATPIKELTRELLGDNFDNDDVKEVKQQIESNKFYDIVFKHTEKVLGKSQNEEQKQLYQDTIKKAFEQFENINIVYEPALNSYEHHIPVSNMVISSREIQQYFGTEICRKLKDSAFTSYMEQQIENTNEDIIFITDGRFVNEIQSAIDLDETKFNVNIMYVFREQKQDNEYVTFQEEYNQHASEKIANDVELMILENLNDKTLTKEKAYEQSNNDMMSYLIDNGLQIHSYKNLNYRIEPNITKTDFDLNMKNNQRIFKIR